MIALLRIRHFLLWIKLYSRLPELLCYCYFPESSSLTARLAVFRSAMEGSVLSMVLFFINRNLFDMEIAGVIFIVTVIALMLYGSMIAPSRNVEYMINNFRSNDVWFPEWFLLKMSIKIISFLLIVLMLMLQTVIVMTIPFILFSN